MLGLMEACNMDDQTLEVARVLSSRIKIVESYQD